MVINGPRKFYYLPGIISLAGIPFLFYFFLYSYEKESAQTVLPLFFWSPTFYPKSAELHPKPQLPLRNYTDIELTGENSTDKVKLDYAQVRLREMMSRQDSLSGIHFSFGDRSQYWTFVKAVNMCYAEGVKSFVPYENHLWAVYTPQEPVSEQTSEYWACGTTYLNFETKPMVWAAAKEKIGLWWRSSWVVIIGFSVLLLVSIRRMVKVRVG